MKNHYSLFLILAAFIMSLSFNAEAQESNDFFPGKWNVIIKDTPEGDASLYLVFERKEGKLTGVVNDPASGKEIAKIESLIEAGTKISFNFFAGGYDLAMTLEKKSDDEVSGFLMDMLEATGKRVREVVE